MYYLKIKLGGKCECECSDLFKLEFDHIDPKIKSKQITRMSNSDIKFDEEIENIQLLCGNCHRIKSFKEQQQKMNKIISKDRKFKNKRIKFINNIKKEIGYQICKWNSNDIGFSYCLNFDHISGNKYKQISDLYNHSLETLTNEILKCRLLCRCCHQLYTCIQRGGKMLKIYYNDKTIKDFEKKFQDDNLNKIFQKEIEQALIKFKDIV